jgi:anti-sigma factor RsiW
MNCGDFESKLADYIDGTLGKAERAALDAHAATCPVCREFMSEVLEATAFLKRVEDLEPPTPLITRIAYQAPLGRTRSHFEKQGFLSGLAGKWLSPILQPRLVMGMAMTVLSFGMLGRCTGESTQTLQPADLSPMRVWGTMEEKAVRVRDRLVKNYENLRVVYEIETRLKDLQQQQDAEQTPSTRNKGAKK